MLTLILITILLLCVNIYSLLKSIKNKRYEENQIQSILEEKDGLSKFLGIQLINNIMFVFTIGVTLLETVYYFAIISILSKYRIIVIISILITMLNFIQSYLSFTKIHNPEKPMINIPEKFKRILKFANIIFFIIYYLTIFVMLSLNWPKIIINI